MYTTYWIDFHTLHSIPSYLVPLSIASRGGPCGFGLAMFSFEVTSITFPTFPYFVYQINLIIYFTAGMEWRLDGWNSSIRR